MPHVELQQTKSAAVAAVSPVITLDSSPKAGAALILAIAIDPTESVAVVNSVTSNGAGWFKLGEIVNTGQTRIEVWAATDLEIGAGQAVTVNCSAFARGGAVVLEYVGIIPSPTDQTANNSGSGVSATTGTTGTTTQDEELAIAAISCDEEEYTFSSPLNGYSIQDEAAGASGFNNQRIAVLDLELTTQQTTSTGLTISSVAAQWAAIIFTLKLYPAGTKTLSGTSVGQSGGLGTFGADVQLSGACVGQSDGTGDLDVEWSLSGACGAQGDGGGDLIVTSSEPPLDVELPVVYVDDAVTDDATGLIVVNRNPEPDETGVPADTSIVIELWNTGSAAIDVSVTRVRIVRTIVPGGQDMYLYGVFVNGYNGTVTPLTSPGAGSPDGWRIEIDTFPGGDFDSLETINTRIRSNVVGGGSLLDQSWSFTIEDLTPPSFLSAVALDQKLVRVTFDEPVKGDNANDSDDALNPSNYTFQALNDDVTPAVPIDALSVEKVSPVEYDITIDTEMTPRVTYEVTAENIVDLYGNPV